MICFFFVSLLVLFGALSVQHIYGEKLISLGRIETSGSLIDRLLPLSLNMENHVSWGFPRWADVEENRLEEEDFGEEAFFVDDEVTTSRVSLT